MLNFSHDMKAKAALMTWDQWSQLHSHEKVPYLSKDGRIYDVLFSQQFNRDLLDRLYVVTNKVRLVSKTREGAAWLQSLLRTKKAMLYFIQPSTRTFLSFWSACATLGMQVVDVRSTETSSEMKGESADDTLRTFASYFDLLITRHPEKGYAERASFILGRTRRPVPVINAGSGKDQHPTQALLDIFSLRRSFENSGGLADKTVMMVGDLKRGRTVRSLVYLLANFPGIRFLFVSPPAFRMEGDIKDFLTRRHLHWEETDRFEEALTQADALYMTRLQNEYDVDGESQSYDVNQYTLRVPHLKTMKAGSVILHPLPRRSEIEEAVDQDPRAVYWRQVRNGMWTRVALSAHLLKVDQAIIDR